MYTYLNRLADVIEQQPDIPAVSDSEKEITFRELGNASDRLGRLMYERRKTENDVFAYLGNPGVERIVCLIAAIKAGAALLGLDPQAPPSVIRDLLETCDVTQILAERDFEEMAKSLHAAEPFVLPDDLLDPATVEPFLRLDCHPEALASILYTSGSTGMMLPPVNRTPRLVGGSGCTRVASACATRNGDGSRCSPRTTRRSVTEPSQHPATA